MSISLHRLRHLPTNILILICLFIFLVCYYFPVQPLPKLELGNEPQFEEFPVHQKTNSSNSVPQSTCPVASTVTSTYSVTREQSTTITEFKISTTTATNTVTDYAHTPTPIALKPSKDVLVPEPSLEQQTTNRLREAGIVVVFKTGAQEVSSLSIQVGTTLRHLTERDILFFSDQAGSIGPFQIHDALRNVNESIRLHSPDFEIYRKIKHYQATGQSVEKLREDASKGDSRSGWKLDKYKFIHMVEEAYELRPYAKWYVFVETDSYIVWENLVQWLETLDPMKPQYIGSVVFIGDVAFGHGGSGYVLSNAAMDKLLGPDQPEDLAAKWDLEMEKHCCGDVALAIALRDQGVHLQGAHPFLNGLKPVTLTYGPTQHWCQPVVSMHHVMPHEVSSIWRFERRREQIHGNSNATTFSELYRHFVDPHLREERDNWDNLSHGPTFSKKIFLEEMAKATQEATKEREKEVLEEEAHKLREEEQARIDEKQKLQKEENIKKEGSDGQPESKGASEEKEDLKREDQPSDKKAANDNKPEELVFKNNTLNAHSKKRDDLPQKNEPPPAEEKKDLANETIKKSEDKPGPNWTDIEKDSFNSFHNCFVACKARADCFQYAWVTEDDGPSCRLGLSFRLGEYRGPETEHPKVTWKSGWILEKIRKWTDENECERHVWSK